MVEQMMMITKMVEYMVITKMVENMIRKWLLTLCFSADDLLRVVYSNNSVQLLVTCESVEGSFRSELGHLNKNL